MSEEDEMSVEHQTRITEGPMTAEEILRWRADGWRLYSVIRPVGDGDKQHSYHFRRQQPDRDPQPAA